MLFFLLACAPTPESFGARYEAAICAEMKVCEGWEEAYQQDCVDDPGYVADNWASMCPDLDVSAADAQACLDAIKGGCMEIPPECDYGAWGCG